MTKPSSLPLKQSVLSGLLFGIVEAVGFSLLGLVALLGRALSLKVYAETVAGYFLGFGIGGLLAGLLWRPLKDSAVGAAVLGLVALGPVWAGAGISYVGLHEFFSTFWLIVWAGLSLLTGCGLALQAWTSHEWPFEQDESSGG